MAQGSVAGVEWAEKKEEPVPRAHNLDIGRTEMTLCPIALIAGCRKCPAFRACPVKGIIGDYEKEEDPGADQPAAKDERDKNGGE